MPTDLALTATVAGEPREFIARDVPTGVFFAGFGDTFPGAECFGKLSPNGQRDVVLGFEAWTDGLLCRVMLEPQLTPEVVQRLGSARDELAVAYLWAIGYRVPPEQERDRLVPPQRIAAPIDRPFLFLEDVAALSAKVAPNVKLALREFTRATRTSIDRVWELWSISKFLRYWHLVVEDDLKKRARQGRVGGRPPQSDIMAAVGREAS